MMELREGVGLAGDGINFAAAVLLAIDPMLQERIFWRDKGDGVLDPDIIIKDSNGKEIPRGEKRKDIEVRGASLRSQIGFWMLLLGFWLILASRWMDIHARSAERPCFSMHGASGPGTTCAACKPGG